MLNMKIERGDIKAFMNSLLTSETFDFFEVRGVDISTLTHFNISGQKLTGEKAEADADDEDEDKPAKTGYCKWSEIRPFVFNLIKGGARPSYIKIVFSMESAQAVKLHENAAAMHLNILYSADEVYFTSATAQKGFSLDKSLDHVWEDYLIEFFRSNSIGAKEIELQ